MRVHFVASASNLVVMSAGAHVANKEFYIKKGAPSTIAPSWNSGGLSHDGPHFLLTRIICF